MFAQGSIFRTRYLLDGNYTGSEDIATTHARLEGVESLAIDNSQTSVISTNDGYISNSALAFMQGFYPPEQMSVAAAAGGLAAAALANGTLIDFPLNGYQYPDVKTLSALDPDFIWYALVGRAHEKSKIVV